jgi:hypothetical protein
LNSSKLRMKFCWTTTWSPTPKKARLSGLRLLTPLGTGSLRASTSVSLVAVMVRNLSCPMMG